MLEEEEPPDPVKDLAEAQEVDEQEVGRLEAGQFGLRGVGTPPCLLPAKPQRPRAVREEPRPRPCASWRPAEDRVDQALGNGFRQHVDSARVLEVPAAVSLEIDLHDQDPAALSRP